MRTGMVSKVQLVYTDRLVWPVPINMQGFWNDVYAFTEFKR